MSNDEIMQMILDELETQLVEPIDCEECAFNAGISTAMDIVARTFNEIE